MSSPYDLSKQLDKITLEDTNSKKYACICESSSFSYSFILLSEGKDSDSTKDAKNWICWTMPVKHSFSLKSAYQDVECSGSHITNFKSTFE